jgi:hypothetical protein
MSEKFHEVVPEFSGRLNDVHRVLFMNQVDTYFSTVAGSNAQKINCVQRRFVQIARIWYDSLLPPPESFEEFKSLFTAQFWSESVENRVHDELLRPYKYHSNFGYTTHAMQWIAKARFLDPPIPTVHLVNVICQHFNDSVCTALLGRGIRTTTELISILTSMENSPFFHSLAYNSASSNRDEFSGNTIYHSTRPTPRLYNYSSIFNFNYYKSS